MILIYDFDGTLTPYSLPQYPIIKKCGYDDISLMDRIDKEMLNGIGFYEAYYKCYKDILAENGILMSKSNICFGAENTTFNNGVLDYFKRFGSSTTGIKHYIVTSGVKDYVDNTIVSNLVDGIYGVTFHQSDGIFQDVNFLLSAKKKIDVIREIQTKNGGMHKIIYFGDGLTDKFAFEYVHSIGGINVFVTANEHSKDNYKKLNSNGIIDKCFEADFSENSPLDNFVRGLIPKKEFDYLEH